MSFSRLFSTFFLICLLCSSFSAFTMEAEDFPGFGIGGGYYGGYGTRARAGSTGPVAAARRDITTLMRTANDWVRRGVALSREQQRYLLDVQREAQRLLDAIGSSDVLFGSAKGSWKALGTLFDKFETVFASPEGADPLAAIRSQLDHARWVVIENITQNLGRNREPVQVALAPKSGRGILVRLVERVKNTGLTCLYSGGCVGSAFLLRNCLKQIAARVNPFLTAAAILVGVASAAGVVGCGKRAKDAFVKIYR